VLYTTALTASPAGVEYPAQAPLTNVQVTIGGKLAAVSFAGLISPGLFQINVSVPAVGPGYQDLLLTSAGVSSPSAVSLFVQ